MSISREEILALLPRFEPALPSEQLGTYEYRTSQVAVAASSAQLLAGDARRVSWTLCNFGAANAFIGFVSPIATTTGFPILANGGVLQSRLFEDKTMPTAAVSVIGSGATTIAIIETIRVD